MTGQSPDRVPPRGEPGPLRSSGHLPRWRPRPVISHLRPAEQGADLVRDGVIDVEHRADGEQDRFVLAPIHSQFNLRAFLAAAYVEPCEGRALYLGVRLKAVSP